MTNPIQTGGGPSVGFMAVIALVAACVTIYFALLAGSVPTVVRVLITVIALAISGGALGNTVISLVRRSA
ncbi:hypothetical protein [Rhodococcus erythropolis]|uniref:Uncharacterized protein n=1 Tax=Rhodococcus erythropolis TaxID=1833 RepID=A0AAX4A058_RHOER|nr:hypothetical protein [Rhodococcus erythropolis]WMN01899.1 hypothetical protein QIE55_31865 [Rhodococcus erythropolis]WMN03185.1 hypothetical protein QIE55_32810 [Rhodococcus erythropolis]